MPPIFFGLIIQVKCWTTLRAALFREKLEFLETYLIAVAFFFLQQYTQQQQPQQQQSNCQTTTTQQQYCPQNDQEQYIVQPQPCPLG